MFLLRQQLCILCEYSIVDDSSVSSLQWGHLKPSWDLRGIYQPWSTSVGNPVSRGLSRQDTSKDSSQDPPLSHSPKTAQILNANTLLVHWRSSKLAWLSSMLAFYKWSASSCPQCPFPTGWMAIPIDQHRSEHFTNFVNSFPTTVCCLCF